MASLGNYTTTEAVRGCLGIDEDDCPDNFMIESNLSLELTVDLDGWLPTHAALYSAGTTGSPTSAQVGVSNRIKLYAQWFCANEMANRPMTVPQITTDGKAQFDRFKVDLVRLAALTAAKMGKYKAELDELVNNVQKPIGLPSSLVKAAIPSQDPITDAIQ